MNYNKKGILGYHVTTLKKLENYKRTGFIKPPVRCWKNPEEAIDFSKRTGRAVIIRIRLHKYRQFEGHKGMAWETLEEISYGSIY